MRIAGILKDSIVNGVGIRDVIFTQGCPHQCEGCHNPETWNVFGGNNVTIALLERLLSDSSNDITISGGEPILQYNEVIKLMRYFTRFQNKRFWLYTGFRYEELPPQQLLELSKYTDVLVDGRYEKDKKDPNLLFRGSSNQRLIDLPKSVKENKIILWEDNV